MSRHPRAFHVIILSALAGLAVVGAMLIVFGCAKVQPGFCAMVKAGLAYVDGQLRSGGEPDAGEFQEQIAPVLAAKGMEDMLEQAKEIWDSIPTEQKLQAAQRVLEYFDVTYCKAGDEQTGRAAGPDEKAEVLYILLRHARIGGAR